MKILVLANFGMGLYKFRKELLQEFINQRHEVYISLPNDEYVPKLEDIGCRYIETTLDRRGTNPIRDIKLILYYIDIIKRYSPDIVLTYTIKPNVYGGIASRIMKTRYIANVTGLGTSIENKGMIQKITLLLYRMGLRKASCVFFQNKTNQEFFIDKRITQRASSRLIPGSGVNLEQHCFEEYPEQDESIRFVFIGRIMKAKGIDELLEAAIVIKEKYPNTHFDFVGSCEENYNERLSELTRSGVIAYHGQQNDVHSYIRNSHATILPSYHEGTANVLLESASSGRPVLASRVPGCIETFDEDVSGIGFEVKDRKSLVEAITKFINLPYDRKQAMGIAGRKKMAKEYDRKIVVHAYLDELGLITEKGI
jgi:glycosyltransferase involved in cell wall biosynthesis